MHVSGYYYEILGLGPDASFDDVKKAYRRLVRKNHPDLFPAECGELQALKMIQINEAYARIVSCYNPGPAGADPPNEGRFPPDLKSGGTEVGFHRDLQYAYYKQGFINFSKALYGIKGIEGKSGKAAGPRNDIFYLKKFSSSLAYLRKADTYFSKLLESYPESMWAYDARVKKRRIEYFNRLYQKIIGNIERKLKVRTKSARCETMA